MSFKVPSTNSTFTAHPLPEPTDIQVATLPLSLMPADPLEEILSLSNQEIFQRGVPLPCIKLWRDRFYEGIDRKETSLIKFSRDDAWAYDPKFFETSGKQMELGFDENGMFSFKQVTHQEYFVTAFHHMMHPAFWEDSGRHIKFLLSLYRLRKTVEFTPNDPVERLFEKLMDCVVEKIVANDPRLQDKEVFSLVLPDSQGHEVAQFKRLCCFKTVNGWRIGDFNAFKDTSLRIVQFNTNNTKKLILDTKDQLLRRPCALIEARVRPEARDGLEKIIKVCIVLYRGPSELAKGKSNAVSFTFDIDTRRPPFQMHRFRQDSPWITDLSECVNHAELQHMKAEAELMFAAFQTNLTAPILKNPLAHVAFELLPPQSATDKLWVLFHLLTELKKDPVAHAEQIAHVAELMDCSFSEEELHQLSSEGKATLTREGCAVSPEAVVDKLLISSKDRLTKALSSPKPPSKDISTSSASPLPQPQKVLSREEQVPSISVVTPTTPLVEKKKKESIDDPAAQKEEAERLGAMEERMLEKQVEKARRRELFEYERRKMESKVNDRDSRDERDSSGLTMFSLDLKDQGQVDSIYQGQPMKAKDFATFAMSLLRKKARSVGAKLHRNTVGSHPKLHFKRTDGTSGGVTFRIHHGGDDHGFLSAQKDTLDRIFNL